ncbi:MAG: methyl-accepting chemotaxis protein [Marinilabiliaceae bacterium]|nr:methyl-accepting chemotaxis protein [Marinilabiliaceae bacterium]
MKINKLTPTILIPFSVMLVGTFLLLIVLLKLIIADVREQGEESLKYAAKTIEDNAKDQMAKMALSAEFINDEYETVYDAVAIQDYDEILDEMRWAAKYFDYDKYVFARMNGDPYITKYDGIDTEALSKLFEETNEKKLVAGFGKLDSKHICQYSSVVVKNTDGEEIALFLRIGTMINGTDYLEQIKESYGLETYVFDTQACIGCSDQSVDFSSIPLNEKVKEECVDQKRKWQGEIDINGQTTTISCIPLKDHNDEVIGVIGLIDNTTVVDRIRSKMRGSFAILLIFVIVAFGVEALLLLKRVVKPIEKIMKELLVISTGDLTQNIEVSHACEELKILTGAVHDMQSKIKEIVKPIVENANLVTESTRQLSNSALALSNASSRQAASLEEISSSMEEMTANIQQNTDNSLQTNKLAKEVDSLVGNMSETSNNSFNAIKEIAANIESINELVSQTNILSLNASVEAARAGDQGKGFAVVAKEVGRLAEQTHDTADSINETAGSSIHEAELAYNNVVQIVPKIEEIVSLINEITTASVEQSSGVGQVNAAIADLNRVTQENAAASEQIAASTSEMQRQLDGIRDLVSVFKVD